MLRNHETELYPLPTLIAMFRGDSLVIFVTHPCRSDAVAGLDGPWKRDVSFISRIG